MPGLLPRFSRLAAAGAILASIGCAPSASLVELAPVSPTPTGEVHPGQIVWHDLVTDDLDAAQDFYGSLFGWTFASVQGDLSVYSVIERNGEPIGGIVPIDDEDRRQQILHDRGYWYAWDGITVVRFSAREEA